MQRRFHYMWRGGVGLALKRPIIYRKSANVPRPRAKKAGRPREFDERAVLEAAMDCFWSQGYEATSMRDLIDRMGITGASLYNAFGDKRTLFRRALDYYLDISLRQRIGRLEGSFAPRDAIEAFFRDTIERSLADKQRRGCLLVNSALEVAPHDAEFQKIIAGVLIEVEAFFRRRVTAGQADGTIAAGQSPRDLARALLGALLGIRVLARTRPQRKLLEGMMVPIFGLLSVPRRLSTKGRLESLARSAGKQKTGLSPFRDSKKHFPIRLA